ncbi:MAG: T9SS type A sorting domain-containing protein [Saprospiraceae bacterium]
MKSRFLSTAKVLFIGFLFLSHGINAKPINSLILHCPPNQYISCSEDLYYLSRFGNATYTIGNYTYSAGMPSVSYHLNSCQVGYITRTWTIEDPYWNWHTCTQTIFVSSGSQHYFHIVWPLDFEVEGCNPNVKPHELPAPHNYPTWTGGECRMIGRSYTDMVFTVNNGCKKIMRTWKLIDWCDNNGWGTQWTHNQIIKIINEERPSLDCPKDFTINAFNCKNARLNAPPLTVGATSCGGSAIISNNSPYSDNKGDDISGVYPIGTTKVTYTIQYGCGSRLFCTVHVIVKNANTPTPYCLHSITTTLMPVDTNSDGTFDDGMVQIWAKDLDKGSKSLCGYDPLRFSFSIDPADMFRTFTCAELGSNEVFMYVTDYKGGQSACLVNVIIQNNSGHIPDCKRKEDSTPTEPQATHYFGLLKDMFGRSMEDAHVSMVYDASASYNTTLDTVEVLKKDSFINASGYLLYFYKKEINVISKTDTIWNVVTVKKVTDSLGNFFFKDVKNDSSAFKVLVEYQEDIRKGIDGKDVEFLTKYLLGDVEFTNAYQFLAADIDGNRTIDLVDLNILIQFVTQQLAELPNKKWAFVDGKNIYEPKGSIMDQNLDFVTKISSLKEYKDTTSVVAIKIGNISNENGLHNTGGDLETRVLTTSEMLTKVYPNPTIKDLYVEIKNIGKESAQFRLNNAKGELIFQKNGLNEGINTEWPIQIVDLPSGLYFYQIICDKQIETGKWLKL